VMRVGVVLLVCTLLSGKRRWLLRRGPAVCGTERALPRRDFLTAY
jgi:hypothetical protein